MEERKCGQPGRESPVSEAGPVDFGEFPETGYGDWEKAAAAALKGAPFEKSLFTQTYEGIRLEPLYTAEHLAKIDAARTLPGKFPSLRGAEASGYLARPWEIAQECSAPTPEAANAALRADLENGVTAIAFRLNGAGASSAGLPSLEFPSHGLPFLDLSFARDIAALLAGIDVKNYPFHVYAGASAAPFVGFLAHAVRKAGGRTEDLRGCVGADPIAAWLAHGKLPCGLDRIFDETAQVIRYVGKNAPLLRVVLLEGDVYHNAGANSAQEVAYVMSAAIETIRALSARGVGVDEFARRLRFEFSLGSNFFMEIAKIRAARVVWSRIAESFGGKPPSGKAEIFARTSSFTKTVYDPYVNMLRNASEAFSGVLGGIDGLTVVPFDEAVRPSDEFSRRVAKNSQIMLQGEYHLLQPVDPAGGSWYLESLTDELSRKIWKTIQEVEADGGIAACVKSGKIQGEIGKILEQRFKKLASRSDRAVGTNMYPNVSEIPLAPARGQAEAKPAVFPRPARDEAGLGAVWARLADGKVWKSEEGALIGLAADAAGAGASLAEVREALNGGAPREAETAITPLAPRRWTEQYEAMRRRTEKFRAETGDNAKIFLANMGPVPQHKARADFITGFMEVANFDVLKNDGYATAEECAAAAAASSADAAVICSTDASYPELVPPLAKLIKEKAPSMKVFLAGAPAEEFKQPYLDAGVDDFISVRSDCLAVLTEIQRAKGML
ncbi:MAG: acyl-CoA mutase large subunit family protein [Synergistaceae bacterium]|jgi:methylmalonyl-CoA mutase|nr:acyl-CoA mutase large subunit family protein [Synergistaceae bacterium]